MDLSKHLSKVIKELYDRDCVRPGQHFDSMGASIIIGAAIQTAIEEAIMKQTGTEKAQVSKLKRKLAQTENELRLAHKAILSLQKQLEPVEALANALRAIMGVEKE